jgi:hypothetical protein
MDGIYIRYGRGEKCIKNCSQTRPLGNLDTDGRIILKLLLRNRVQGFGLGLSELSQLS